MKILIVRFSSFGDVLQTLSVAGRLAEVFPQAELHWVSRAEFAPLIAGHPGVHKVWQVEKGSGFFQLLALARKLRREGFTHVYDAHANLRSHILGWHLQGLGGWRVWSGQLKFLRRPLYRWKRFLLFRFQRNLFPQPFSGQYALLEPLRRWGIEALAPPTPQLFLPADEMLKMGQILRGRDFVALAPSAAFPLKRWPLEHWQALIAECKETSFVVLGGPQDLFLQRLVAVDPKRVLNLAGQLSLLESAVVVAQARALVSNDTGLMHVAEQLGKPCLALMGPAPFGFPSRPLTEIFEVQLACRPCSKHGQGPCVNREFQKCLRDIAPRTVAQSLRRMLDAKVATPLPPR